MKRRDTSSAPDHRQLFDRAASRHGLFTAAEAKAAGLTAPLLAYHAKRGRFLRLGHGIYRLTQFPSELHDDVVKAALETGAVVDNRHPHRIDAVASHATALTLHGLSDVIPDRYEFTVPYERRYLRSPAGVRLHITKRPVATDDVEVIDGVLVTSAARAIVDSAIAGYGPEQIQLAVRQSLARAKATPTDFERAVVGAPRRVRILVESAVCDALREREEQTASLVRGTVRRAWRGTTSDAARPR